MWGQDNSLGWNDINAHLAYLQSGIAAASVDQQLLLHDWNGRVKCKQSGTWCHRDRTPKLDHPQILRRKARCSREWPLRHNFGMCSSVYYRRWLLSHLMQTLKHQHPPPLNPLGSRTPFWSGPCKGPSCLRLVARDFGISVAGDVFLQSKELLL